MPEHAAPSPSALVTGAARRVGLAIAADLAAHGFAVALHCNTSCEEADDAVAAILEAGGSAAAITADLTDRHAVAGLVDAARQAIGPLTLLVNNASVFEYDDLETLDHDIWDRQMAVHLEAPAFLARDFVAQLPADAEGNIVNIIDQRVWRPTPHFFSYTTAKSALWAATRTMAQTLAPRVRVNAIGPGPTLPGPRQSEADFAAQVAAVPLQRGPSPE
ncbi:MAG: SDR family oxidoreductase, partial [Hyphomicrobiales bacterium]|nr:SDR family oxidoreductase [Hyphomicrobiales bacterium]